MNFNLFIAFLSLNVLGYCYSVKIITVDTGWLVYNQNNSINITAKVPGSIHTDLMRANIIGDPYYRFNDVAYRWVVYENWTYETSLLLSSVDLAADSINISLEGVDTAAWLSINGHHVTSLNNMYLAYTLTVKQYLKVGPNTLQLRFESPVSYAATQAGRYPYDVPPDCPPLVQHGECHFNFIRKSPASFSWDWGPAFPTVGIWKNLRLVFHNETYLSDITSQSRLIDSTWHITVTPSLQPASATVEGLLRAVIRLHSAVTKATADVIADVTTRCSRANTPTSCLLKFNVSDTQVRRWWPNGHGDQTPYDLEVTWLVGDNTSAATSHVTKKLYFRTVELVQAPIPAVNGTTFYFKINDKPIFMKGSNWIPADSLQERVSRTRVRRLLTSAQLVHMNVLRVWGGGVYESEEFYALADELGLMLWQDFMLACALYPVDGAFLSSVESEVTYQIQRLQMHPSVVIWAGNNENEVALAENWYGVPSENRSHYYDDYRTLYLHTVAPLVAKLDPTRPFVPSSPSNGPESAREGGIAANPKDEMYGDVHFYNYTSDAWNASSFPVPRFASEFGLQSWPALRTLLPVAESRDLTLDSAFVEHRQHRTQGNALMMLEVQQHLNFSHSGDPQKDFANFIPLSQINQAVSMKTEVEHYRRHQSALLSDGRGYTMGALYWQLNDVWQAPTWASIDYTGRWKFLHYFARHFFAPVLVSPVRNPDDSIHIYVIDDTLPPFTVDQSNAAKQKSSATLQYNTYERKQDFQNGSSVLNRKHFGGRSILGKMKTADSVHTLRQAEGSRQGVIMSVYTWSSLKPIKVWRFPVKEQTVASTLVASTTVLEVMTQSHCDVTHCFLYFGLETDPVTDRSQVTDRSPVTNWLLLSNFTDVQNLQQPNITVTEVHPLTPHMVTLTLVTDLPAAFVWLELADDTCQGHFSNNGFLLVEPRVTLTYTSFEPLNNPSSFTPKSFIVRSLVDWQS